MTARQGGLDRMQYELKRRDPSLHSRSRSDAGNRSGRQPCLAVKNFLERLTPAIRFSWWSVPQDEEARMNVRFSNRPFRVKRFQTIHHYSVDVAHGLVLLFGIGTRGPSIMGFEDEVEQSFGRPCRQTNGRSKRTCELTSSIVPRGTSFHRSVEFECPSIGLDAARFSCCCCGLFSGPAELGAVNPYAVHDHSQPACQGHDRLL